MMIIIIVMIVTTVVGLSLSVKQVPAASYHWSFHFHLLVVFSTFLPWSFFTLFSLFILSAFVHWFFFSIFFIGLLSNFLCWSFFPIFFIGLLSNFLVGLFPLFFISLFSFFHLCTNHSNRSIRSASPLTNVVLYELLNRVTEIKP